MVMFSMIIIKVVLAQVRITEVALHGRMPDSRLTVYVALILH